MWPLRKRRDVFDGTPGPSPWYLLNGGPNLPGFKWQGAGKSPNSAGATVLVGRSGPVLILDFYNYVSLFGPGHLLIWHQRHVEGGPTEPVVIRVLEYTKLPPLQDDLEGQCCVMRQEKRSLTIGGTPTCELRVPTVVADLPQRLSFPAQLGQLAELLILCHSSGIESHPTWDRSNLALLIARPSANAFQLYPQDWFNSAGLDYGYQGVTRVARNESTGRVHGEGIRIDSFVLDESLKRTA